MLGHEDLCNRIASDHEVRTAPLFTRDAYVAASDNASFPQRGVLGTVLGLGCVLFVDHRRRCRDGDREIWIGHQASSPTFTVFTGRRFMSAMITTTCWPIPTAYG